MDDGRTTDGRTDGRRPLLESRWSDEEDRVQLQLALAESAAAALHSSAHNESNVQQMCYFALLDYELLIDVLDRGGNATALSARDLACLRCTSKMFNRQTVEGPARHLLRSMDPIFAAWLQADEGESPAAGSGWMDLRKLCAFEVFAAQEPLSWATSRLEERCTFLQQHIDHHVGVEPTADQKCRFFHELCDCPVQNIFAAGHSLASQGQKGLFPSYTTPGHHYRGNYRGSLTSRYFWVLPAVMELLTTAFAGLGWDVQRNRAVRAPEPPTVAVMLATLRTLRGSLI